MKDKQALSIAGDGYNLLSIQHDFSARALREKGVGEEVKEEVIAGMEAFLKGNTATLSDRQADELTQGLPPVQAISIHHPLQQLATTLKQHLSPELAEQSLALSIAADGLLDVCHHYNSFWETQLHKPRLSDLQHEPVTRREIAPFSTAVMAAMIFCGDKILALTESAQISEEKNPRFRRERAGLREALGHGRKLIGLQEHVNESPQEPTQLHQPRTIQITPKQAALHKSGAPVVSTGRPRDRKS